MQKLDKLKKAFIEGIEFLSQNGRVHPIYNLAPSEKRGGKEDKGGTKTGRISSSTPNIQQMPKDGYNLWEHFEWGEEMYYPREYFLPEAGCVFLFCDYDQQEFRMLGALAKEENLKAAIEEGYDIHTAPAIVTGKQIGRAHV